MHAEILANMVGVDYRDCGSASGPADRIGSPGGLATGCRHTVRALLALEMPSINPLTDPYTLAGVAVLAVRLAAMRRNRATPTDPVNAV
jgi:hypothetical protein